MNRLLEWCYSHLVLFSLVLPIALQGWGNAVTELGDGGNRLFRGTDDCCDEGETIHFLCTNCYQKPRHRIVGALFLASVRLSGMVWLSLQDAQAVIISKPQAGFQMG